MRSNLAIPCLLPPEEVEHFFADTQDTLYFYARAQLWKRATSQSFVPVSLPLGFVPFAIFADGSFAGNWAGRLAVLSAQGQVLYQSDYALNQRSYRLIGTDQQFLFWQRGSSCEAFRRKADGSYENTPFPLQPREDQSDFLLHYDTHRGHIWVSKLKQGLFLFDTNYQLLFQHRLRTRTACVDQVGNLWAGKFELSVLQLRESKFQRMLYTKDLEKDRPYQCRGILEQEGQLWVNTYRGLQILDTVRQQVKHPLRDLRPNFALLRGKTQQFWLAYEKLHEYVNGNLRSYPLPPTGTEKRQRVWSLFQGETGKLWLGGRGLMEFTAGEVRPFEQYGAYETLRQGLILFIQADREGVIWIGSDRGLFQLDPSQGIVAGFGKNQPGISHFPSSNIQHLHQDAQGIYWIATADIGLIRWDRQKERIQVFGKKEGLPTNNIYAVYEDAYGYLWMSSFNGLIRFHKTDHSLLVFHEEDGICDDEFNRIAHHQGADGHLYFGGPKRR